MEDFSHPQLVGGSLGNACEHKSSGHKTLNLKPRSHFQSDGIWEVVKSMNPWKISVKMYPGEKWSVTSYHMPLLRWLQ